MNEKSLRFLKVEILISFFAFRFAEDDIAYQLQCMEEEGGADSPVPEEVEEKEELEDAEEANEGADESSKEEEVKETKKVQKKDATDMNSAEKAKVFMVRTFALLRLLADGPYLAVSNLRIDACIRNVINYMPKQQIFHEMDVSPFAVWEKELPKIIHDWRYTCRCFCPES